MTEKMVATIHYLRNAAEALLRAADCLESQSSYHHEHARGHIASAIKEAELCDRHILRALEARHEALTRSGK